jgi:hypothetical protein
MAGSRLLTSLEVEAYGTGTVLDRLWYGTVQTVLVVAVYGTGPVSFIYIYCNWGVAGWEE